MIGTGYTVGGGGRLFSRAPKSPAAAAPWWRRRRHKNTAPRISATPRRPPITPPMIAPLPPPPDEPLGGEFAGYVMGTSKAVWVGTGMVLALNTVLSAEGVGGSRLGGAGVLWDVGMFRDTGVPGDEVGAQPRGFSSHGSRTEHKPNNLQFSAWALAKGIDDV